MKLYREVKASERLPVMEDSYTIIINGVKSVAEFHMYDNPQPHLHIKPNMWTKDDRHGYEYEVSPGSWLEPIEITEEEIQGFITESEDAYGRPASLAVEIGISWIMDKLNESK